MQPRMLCATAALLGLGIAHGANQADVETEPQHLLIATDDGARIAADQYGYGARGVVLVHGGRLTKESWSAQARILASAGFRVLAIDLRGFGGSTGPGQADPFTAPLYRDVLAAVRRLRTDGAATVAVIGASMGGWAAADAVAMAKPGEISRLVELGAAAGNLAPEKLLGPKLIIVSRGDRSGDGLRLPGIRRSFAAMPEPKRLLVVAGSAHAQALFATSQGELVIREILRFLSIN